MSFLIPDVPLIPQSKDMACWFASAKMLVSWRDSRKKKMCLESSPNVSTALKKTYQNNTGLTPKQFSDLAKSLGLKQVPPMTPGVDAIANWLSTCGPIWFAGYFPLQSGGVTGHVVVITGIDADSIHINDPWPVGAGRKRKISFSEFGKILRPIDVEPDGIFDGINRYFGWSKAPLASNLMYYR